MDWDDMVELARRDAEAELAQADGVQPMLAVGGDDPWVIVWCRPAAGCDLVLALDEMCTAGVAVGARRAELRRSVWVQGDGPALLVSSVEVVADGLVQAVEIHPFTRAVRGVRWGPPERVAPEECRSVDLGLLAGAVREGPHLQWPDVAGSMDLLSYLTADGHDVMVSDTFAVIADIAAGDDHGPPGE